MSVNSNVKPFLLIISSKYLQTINVSRETFIATNFQPCYCFSIIFASPFPFFKGVWWTVILWCKCQKIFWHFRYTDYSMPTYSHSLKTPGNLSFFLRKTATFLVFLHVQKIHCFKHELIIPTLLEIYTVSSTQRYNIASSSQKLDFQTICFYTIVSLNILVNVSTSLSNFYLV